jgi:hypothetical protein
MSVNELIESLASAGENGQEIDFRAIRERVYEEHDRATSIEDRVKLLQVFNLVMDLVERNLERNGTAPNVIQDFRNARESDYRLLLVKESMAGENVCADTLAAVTQREISAGRMTRDHSLYTMAQEQVAGPHVTRAELVAIAAQREATPALAGQPKAGWRRAFGWMRQS